MPDPLPPDAVSLIASGLARVLGKYAQTLKSSQNGLDLSADIRLSVPSGEPPRREETQA